MSKILATLIASLFAVSVFAADAPKPTTPEVKPAVEVKAPAATEPKAAVKEHQRKAKAKTIAKTDVPAANATKPAVAKAPEEKPVTK